MTTKDLCVLTLHPAHVLLSFRSHQSGPRITLAWSSERRIGRLSDDARLGGEAQEHARSGFERRMRPPYEIQRQGTQVSNVVAHAEGGHKSRQRHGFFRSDRTDGTKRRKPGHRAIALLTN